MSSNGETEDGTVDSRDVAELLARLLDKSLVIFEEGPDGGRFRLQELVREYGREITVERGEMEAVRQRHQRYFTGLALDAERGLSTREQPAWLSRLESEHDNLRVTLESAVSDRSDPEHCAARITGAIWRFWYFRGYLAEGRRWLNRALDRAGLPPEMRAKALNGAGALAREAGDYEAAKVLHEESIGLYRDLGDDRGLAGALGNLGNLALNMEEYGTAEARYRSSLAIYRKLNDRQRAAYNLNNLGVVARHYRDTEAAWALYLEALAIHREVGNRQWEGITLSNLCSLALFEKKYDEAREFGRQSLLIRREMGDRVGIAISLESFGALTVVDDALPLGKRDLLAARLYGAAEALRQQLGAARHADEREEWNEFMSILRDRLSEEDLSAALAAGAKMPIEAVIDLALEGPKHRAA